MNDHFKNPIIMSTVNIYNLIILDESGSMDRIRQNALSGINETIQSIRSAERDMPQMRQYVSIVTFSGSGVEGVRVRRDRMPVENIQDLTLSDYRPNDCTPLYDAIGKSVSDLREHIHKEDRVLVTIITDGLENASRKFRQYDICPLISSLRETGWTFSFIGANQDSVLTAQQINIDNALDFSCTPQGIEEMSLKLCKAQHRFYSFVDRNLSAPSASCDLRHLFDENQD